MRRFRNVPKSPEFLINVAKRVASAATQYRRAPEGPAELSASVVSVLSTLRQAGRLPRAPPRGSSCLGNVREGQRVWCIRQPHGCEIGDRMKPAQRGGAALQVRAGDRREELRPRPSDHKNNSRKFTAAAGEIGASQMSPIRIHNLTMLYRAAAMAELLFERAARDPRRSDRASGQQSAFAKNLRAMGSGVKPEAA
jgi:hypothetical protein